MRLKPSTLLLKRLLETHLGAPRDFFTFDQINKLYFFKVKGLQPVLQNRHFLENALISSPARVSVLGNRPVVPACAAIFIRRKETTLITLARRRPPDNSSHRTFYFIDTDLHMLFSSPARSKHLSAHPFLGLQPAVRQATSLSHKA